LIERAERALAALSSERVSAAVASVAFDWAEILLGHGARRELFEQWKELEERAGPEAPKSVIPLIYFHSIDDFDAARQRQAVEAEWYRVRGEEGWVAERLAHLGFAEFRAGRWDLAERLVEEACTTIAQVERPGPWTTLFRFRSIVDAGRGRTKRARTTMLPLIDEANRSGRAVWEALFLSTLAFVEFADDDHAAVDATLTRMHRCTEDVGVRDLAPDRSEPLYVESLVALGQVERARGALARLEERGRVFPRLWIDVTLPRTQAIVLAAEGKLEDAFAALDALDDATAAKLPFDLAWTLLVRGRLQRRAKQRHAAAETLRAALEQFEQLGAPSWIKRTRAELDRVGLRRAPTELTPTERRVFAMNFASHGKVTINLTNNHIGGPLDVIGGLSRPDAVVGATTTITSHENIYSSRGPSDVEAWKIVGGSSLPFGGNANSDSNSASVQSKDDQIENFKIGIAAIGGRRLPGEGTCSHNKARLELLHMTLATNGTDAADFDFTGALSLVVTEAGNANVVHVLTQTRPEAVTATTAMPTAGPTTSWFSWARLPHSPTAITRSTPNLAPSSSNTTVADRPGAVHAARARWQAGRLRSRLGPLQGGSQYCDQRQDAGCHSAHDAAPARPPVTEQVGNGHSKAGEEHVPTRYEDDRATHGLVAGVQDDESDDGANRTEHVPEPDQESPQSHVFNVLGVDVEKLRAPARP
jgi:tetratricopeptide (TPR) repeat protein